MRKNVLRAGLVSMVAWYLSGCAVTATVPPGEPVYEPPAVVEAPPPVAVWAWWPWPHYDVEHHYVVENDHVTIRDRHYFPLQWAVASLHPQRQGPTKAGTSTSAEACS